MNEEQAKELRDRFAMAALPSLILGMHMMSEEKRGVANEYIAKVAYDIADALMKQRGRVL